jgi:predicted dehydrogenase/threonine dehydrogenase-like Zn-dependent dehydrogenase
VKQVLRKGFKHIVVDDVPDPVLAPHHVLVRPHYSLISSGTETASIHPDLLKTVAENPSHARQVIDVASRQGPVSTLREVQAKFRAYAVLGYAGAGVIVDRHSTVTDFAIGDRVAYGGEGTGHAETILAGRHLTARVPDGLGLDQAAFATLGAIAMNAVRQAEIQIGDVVAVVGLGLVGQIVTQLVRQQGGVAIGIDLKQERVDLALQLGADRGVSGAAVVDDVRAVTDGRGADCVIVAAAAKSDGPATLALELCRDRGRIVVVGAIEMNFPWLAMYLKEVRVVMARAYGPGSYDRSYEVEGRDYPLPYVRWTGHRNMEEFLRLVALGRVAVAPLVTHSFELDEAPQAYETIMGGGSSLAVLLRYPERNLAEPSQAPAVFNRTIRLTSLHPSRDDLRVALVGASGIARWAHLPAIGRRSGTGLRAVFSTSGARGKTYAMRYGASYCTSEYRQILDDPEVDVVLIVTRNQHHAPQALAALRAGKHVFVEKPMALTADECRDLEAAVNQSGRQLMVGFNRRFAKLYAAEKAQIARRTGPAVINCRINSPGLGTGHWMADPSTGGAILGEACHFIDLMYWMLEAEPVSVFAYSLPSGRKDPIGENNLAAVFQFADGSVGTLTYCTVGSKTSGGERVEIFGPGVGAVSEDFKTLAIHGTWTERRSRFFAEKGYARQWDAFVGAIRSGRPVPVGVGDGSRATIGCLALLESARTGRAVDFLVASADTAPVSCDTTASGLASPERMTPAMKAPSPARRPAVAREASGG